MAYTIAGTVVVITAGGVVYYLNDSQKKSSAAAEKKKSKKERRKEKKEKEEAAAQGKAADGIKLQDEEAGRQRQALPCPPSYDNTDAGRNSHRIERTQSAHRRGRGRPARD